MFYAAGQLSRGGASIFVSPDGLDWEIVYTDRRKKSPKASRMYDVAVGDGLMIAGGGHTSHGGDSCFYYSENGRDWTEGSGYTKSKDAKRFDFGASVFTVAHGDGRYVAHGGAPAHGWYFHCASDDGKEWTKPDKEHSFRIGSIYQCVFGGDRFVGIGGHSRVTISTDGRSWEDAKDVPPLISIGYAGDQFIGGGMHGLLATSADGFDWKIHNNDRIGEHIKAIIDTGSEIVAVGIEVTYRSKDGIRWTRDLTNARPARVCYGGGRFIALNGRGTKVYYSTDAIEWTRGPDIEDAFINGGIIYSDGSPS